MNTDNSNPYVGLRPFEMDESLLFFGRNEQTLELLQRLHEHHFVAVVGSSGSGKSSLLRAGLIPALKAGYLVENSDHWFIATMKPGQNPLYNIAESILLQINPEVKSESVNDLIKKIQEEGADAILNSITPVWKERNINFFLLVDQFEELFRFAMELNDVNKKDEAIDFVNIMLELSQQSEIPFYVVLTMRSDFIGDCVQFYGLPEAMNKSQYLVPKLNRIQLKTVIEGPAKLYGGSTNPALTSRLLNELGKVKDELPLLQHALMRIWGYERDTDKNGELDLNDFEKIGGLEKALSNHADEALAGMTKEDLNITKVMFQALTAIDENGRKIRRPVMLSQLKELTGATEQQLNSIINLFIKDRRCFLIVNSAANSNDKVIDISHESLIRQWNTLSQWVDEEGESASIYKRLIQDYNLHKLNKKDFLSGSELQIALDWYTRYKPQSIWANRYLEGFDESINYLLESDRDWKTRQKNERDVKQKLRNYLYGGIAVVILGLFASLFIYSKIQHNKAVEKEKDKVTLESEKAKEQERLAKISAELALSEKQKAEEQKMEAIEQKHFAEVATKEALMQKHIAEQQIILAKKSAKEATAARDEAYKLLEVIRSTNDSLKLAIEGTNIDKETKDKLISVQSKLEDKIVDYFYVIIGSHKLIKDAIAQKLALRQRKIKYEAKIYQSENGIYAVCLAGQYTERVEANLILVYAINVVKVPDAFMKKSPKPLREIN